MSRAFCVALIVAGASLGASPLQGQEPEKVVPLDGTQAFRQVLDHLEFQSLTTLEAFRESEPKEVLLIVFGSSRALDQIGRLREFVTRGGALLVASEEADAGRLREFRVSILGGRVSDQVRNFLGNVECPLLNFAERHPLFQNVRHLATNRPSTLSVQELPKIAFFSEHAFAQLRKEGPLTFAAGGTVQPGGGRVLILAGYGQFSNGMMLRLDNDNFTFAWNCVRWLQESEQGGKRKHALLVENGTIVKSFKGPLAISVPPLSLAAVVNHALHRMQEENLFNRLLHSLVSPEWIWRGVLIVLTAFLIFFGRLRLMRARERAPAGLPLVDQSVAAMIEELPLLSRRHRAMIKSGNYYEAARTLARHFFEVHVGPAAADGPPPVQAAGGWWRRRTSLRDLQGLWQLAYGPAATPISAGRLRDIVRTCERYDRALRRGELLFDAAVARKSLRNLGQAPSLP